MYEKKLRKLLESGGHDEQVNGEEENAGLYSDSEDEDGENKFWVSLFCLLGDTTAWFTVRRPLQGPKEPREKGTNTLSIHRKT